MISALTMDEHYNRDWHAGRNRTFHQMLFSQTVKIRFVNVNLTKWTVVIYDGFVAFLDKHATNINISNNVLKQIDKLCRYSFLYMSIVLVDW